MGSLLRAHNAVYDHHSNVFLILLIMNTPADGPSQQVTRRIVETDGNLRNTGKAMNKYKWLTLFYTTHTCMYVHFISQLAHTCRSKEFSMCVFCIYMYITWRWWYYLVTGQITCTMYDLSRDQMMSGIYNILFYPMGKMYVSIWWPCKLKKQKG